MATSTYDLSGKLRAVRESERQRIASELHDGIGQQLCALKLKLEMSLDSTPRDGAGQQETLHTAVGCIEQVLHELQRISHELAEPDFPNGDFMDRLEALCREFEVLHPRIRLSRHYEIDETTLPANLKATIYRIVQEALNNIDKHAGASHAVLRLEHDTDEIKLEIADNGRGLDSNRLRSDRTRLRFGLDSMRNRTRITGGHFVIRTEHQGGTTVEVCWSKSAVAELERG